MNTKLNSPDLDIDDTPDDTEWKLIRKFRQLDSKEKAYFMQEINRSAMAAQRCRQNDADRAARRD
jgi:hypothetical protein